MLKPDLSWASLDLFFLYLGSFFLFWYQGGGGVPRTLFGLAIVAASSRVWTVLKIFLYSSSFNGVAIIGERVSLCSRSVFLPFRSRRAGGRPRCLRPGCPGRWHAARYCLVMSSQCCPTGSILHSLCRCSGLDFWWQPVAIPSALFWMTCNASQFESLSVGDKTGCQWRAYSVVHLSTSTTTEVQSLQDTPPTQSWLKDCPNVIDLVQAKT